MKGLLLFFTFCLIGLQPLRAEVVVLDSGDIQDWVRIMEQSYPKYKDTMIRPTALLKFRTDDIPADAKIENAYLRFYVLKCASGATISLSHVTDDSWSFDTTGAEELFLWPVDSVIGSYPSG